jgi:CheY-like chemotaxis protein
VTDGRIYKVSCIPGAGIHGNFVGHHTFAEKHGCTAPPVSTCLPIRMPTRILIAEDNPAVRTALRSLLKSAGHWDLVEVENGQEALAKAEELKPNLIILDLVMPVMDGLSAARQISKLLPEIPMLMHTMHWSPQVELEAQKVGVRQVISKADSTLLVATVRQLLTPEPPPPLSVASVTIPSNILTPNVAPPSAILEPGSASPSDNPDAPATTDSGDIPGNRSSS